MEILQARVKGGRLILDEPTDLPEGEVVNVVVLEEASDVVDDMTDEEREELHRELDASIDEYRRRSARSRSRRAAFSRRCAGSSPEGGAPHTPPGRPAVVPQPLDPREYCRSSG
jgi:predicted DNA-binding antitoxin AbrB/MazE fold protein